MKVLNNWVFVQPTPYTAPELGLGFISADNPGEGKPYIITSPVVSAEGRVITTYSGSKYLLGTPLPAYAKAMDDAGTPINMRFPFGDKR